MMEGVIDSLLLKFRTPPSSTTAQASLSRFKCSTASTSLASPSNTSTLATVVADTQSLKAPSSSSIAQCDPSGSSLPSPSTTPPTRSRFKPVAPSPSVPSVASSSPPTSISSTPAPTLSTTATPSPPILHAQSRFKRSTTNPLKEPPAPSTPETPTIKLKTANSKPPIFLAVPVQSKFKQCSTNSEFIPPHIPAVSEPLPPILSCENIITPTPQPTSKSKPVFPLLGSPQLIPEPTFQNNTTSQESTSKPSTPESIATNTTMISKPQADVMLSNSPTQPTIVALPLHSISPLISPSPGRLVLAPESFTKSHHPVVITLNAPPPVTQQPQHTKAIESEQEPIIEQHNDNIDTNIYLNMDFVPAEPQPNALDSDFVHTPSSLQLEPFQEHTPASPSVEVDPIHISPQPPSMGYTYPKNRVSKSPQLSRPINLSASLEGFSSIPSTTTSTDTTPSNATTTHSEKHQTISDLYTLDVFTYLDEDATPPLTSPVLPIKLPTCSNLSQHTVQDNPTSLNTETIKPTTREQLLSLVAAASTWQPSAIPITARKTNIASPKKPNGTPLPPHDSLSLPACVYTTAPKETDVDKSKKRGARVEYFSIGQKAPSVTRSGDDWEVLRSANPLSGFVSVQEFVHSGSTKRRKVVNK